MKSIKQILSNLSGNLNSTVDLFAQALDLCSTYGRGSSIGASKRSSSASTDQNVSPVNEKPQQPQRRSVYC